MKTMNSGRYLLPAFLLTSAFLLSCSGDGDTMLDAIIVTTGGSVNAIKSHSIPREKPGSDATESVFVFGSFGQTGTDAGTFTINGVEVAKQQAGSVVSYNSTIDGQTFPDLKFDGSDHVFALTGSQSVPAFTLTVRSPEDFEVTAPDSGPSYIRTKDLDINWTGGSASSTDSITISISDDGTSSNAYTVTALPNTGTYSIPYPQLSRFADTAVLIVSKYRNAVNTTDGKRFTAISEVRWAFPVILK